MYSVIWPGNSDLKVDVSSGNVVIRFTGRRNLNNVTTDPSKICFVQIGDALRITLPGIRSDLILTNMKDASKLRLILKCFNDQFNLGNEIRK
jgi:hypothetical protein